MTKKVGVGTDLFEKFIEGNRYYVDKTELLYDLVEDTGNGVTLFTRPRRFGKTLMMSMMDCFFDIRRDCKELFSNLKIVKNHPAFCEDWMNQYPTLFLSLKDVDGMTYDDAFAMLKSTLSRLSIEHAYLADAKTVNAVDRDTFQRLKNRTATKDEVIYSLDTIMRMMYTVHGKTVILLIDEYDVPLAKAQEKGYSSEMLDTLRGLMSVSLKTNNYLKFAVLTGCLQISRESIFTGVNNFECYSVMGNDFNQYFGFTQDEVKSMLEYFDRSEYFDIIQSWYDGYVFGNGKVFCPWDIVNYISRLRTDRDALPEAFWVNSSGNAILESFLNNDKLNPADEFETLLNGGTITREISTELTYNELYDSKENIWSVLLMTGYITKADEHERGPGFRLRIPNAEIAEIFQKAVIDRFIRKLDAPQVDAFLKALWNGDEQTASETLSAILWNSISFNDYDENYYHEMLNGIFTSGGYAPDSNAEAGLGRLDLRIRDHPNRRCMLFEFKADKNLEAGCKDAIDQMIRNGYDKTMPEGYTQQIVYGICFYRKSALVKLKK